eukprot:3738783-Amphidinium_carterae.1
MYDTLLKECSLEYAGNASYVRVRTRQEWTIHQQQWTQCQNKWHDMEGSVSVLTYLLCAVPLAQGAAGSRDADGVGPARDNNFQSYLAHMYTFLPTRPVKVQRDLRGFRSLESDASKLLNCYSSKKQSQESQEKIKTALPFGGWVPDTRAYTKCSLSNHRLSVAPPSLSPCD